MKTAISVPDPIFEAGEQLARRLGISRSELYATAVKRLLEAYDDSAITAALNEVFEAEESKLDPVLAQMQFASLESDEWE
jgi:metal-responsive CopG/Arc/MetJ family transcriptional regulator